MSNSNINRINWTKVFISFFFRCFVLLCLRNDGVDSNSRFSSLSITNNQLTLTSTNWNHRVNRHDTSLKWLANRLSWYDTRSNFFDGIVFSRSNVTFTVNWLTQCVYYTAEEFFSNRNLKQLASCFHFIALFDIETFTEKNASDFCFLQVKSKSIKTTRKLDHLIKHDITQSFDFSNTITNLTNGSNVRFSYYCFKFSNLCF